MNPLNSVLFEGKIKSFKTWTTAKGLTITEIAVSTSRTFRADDGSFLTEENLFTCQCFGNLAKVAAENCGECNDIRAVGRLREECFIDGDGKKQSRIVVIAEHVEFRNPVKAENLEVKEDKSE